MPREGMRFFWLIYVMFVFMGPLMGRSSWVDWALAAGSIVIFLPLYFGYWAALEGRRRHALAYVVAIALLGFALLPVNTGSTTYLIYSVALVPFVLRPRLAMAYIAGLGVAVVVAALGFPAPVRYWLGGSTGVMLVMIGGGNLFYAEHVRRSAQLWRAQQDVEDMATLAERERISRDLHDLLGHTLSVTALKSELAARLAETDPARAAAEIRDVERVSRDALSEVRAAVEGYRARGFAGELKNGAMALESAGVRLVAEIGQTKMPVRQESVIALALREALTNVVRHAGASTCHVTLRQDEGQVVLTVQDDGAGGTLREGHGLTGMRERVAALGGQVTLDGSRGTRLTVTLP